MNVWSGKWLLNGFKPYTVRNIMYRFDAITLLFNLYIHRFVSWSWYICWFILWWNWNCLFNKIVISFIRANHFCWFSAIVCTAYTAQQRANWKIHIHKVLDTIFWVRCKSASSWYTWKSAKAPRTDFPFSSSPTQKAKLSGFAIFRSQCCTHTTHTRTARKYFYSFAFVFIIWISVGGGELLQLLLFSWVPQYLHLNGNGNVGVVAIVPCTITASYRM